MEVGQLENHINPCLSGSKKFLQMVIEWLIALCFMDRVFNSENSRPIRHFKDHGSIMAND
jgi:hypothetical protein